MNKTIHLQHTEGGHFKEWRAVIEGNRVTYTWGKIGGTMQSETKEYTEGKNAGRSNATTPAEQCLFDAEVKARKKIEKGYRIVEGGFEVASETTSDLSIPEPMLAQTLQKHMSKFQAAGDAFFQPKLDGNRALFHRPTGRMYSRNRKPITHLAHITNALSVACQGLPDDIEWIDGELYSPNMSFNELQGLIRRVSKSSDPALLAQLGFYVFDVVSDLPFSQRSKAMIDLIQPNQYVRVTPTFANVASEQNLETYHNMFVNGGFEGVMVRIPTMPYEHKRSMSLFKYKAFEDAEFAVVGFVAEKNNPNTLGSVTVMDARGKTFNARPAMSDAMKQHIWDNREQYKGRTATVKYQNLDEVSGIPRFPVLMRFRAEE